MKYSGYTVYVSSDYRIFKHLTGNRRVNSHRVEKIKASIKAVGQIISPIVVNENYEIIDGQGRVEAFKDMGLPVYFVIQQGAGIKECISMNIYQSNWKVTDYIESYAEQGDPNYMRFLHTVNKYRKQGIDLRAITSVLEKGRGEIASQVMMDGRLTYSEADKEEAEACLSYICEFTQILNESQVKSNRPYQTSVAWLYYYDDVDNNRFLEKVRKSRSMLCTAGDIEQAVSTLEEIYNYKSRDKRYFAVEMKRQRDEYQREKTALHWKEKNK